MEGLAGEDLVGALSRKIILGLIRFWEFSTCLDWLSIGWGLVLGEELVDGRWIGWVFGSDLDDLNKIGVLVVGVGDEVDWLTEIMGNGCWVFDGKVVVRGRFFVILR